MKAYRGQILKVEGNVTYVCFSTESNILVDEENELTNGSLALAEE